MNCRDTCDITAIIIGHVGKDDIIKAEHKHGMTFIQDSISTSQIMKDITDLKCYERWDNKNFQVGVLIRCPAEPNG